MKKLYTLISLLVLASSLMLAQTPDNRTTNTVIIDDLAQLPADKPSIYNNVMKDILSTKEAGILQLVGMMKNPAKGDNAKIEYALNGLTLFASTNSEEARLATSKAYIKALDTTNERETKAFVIRQLEVLANDEAVEKLSIYLNDESLVAPASIALASNGSENAGKALMDALPKASSSLAKQSIVSALGFMKEAKAESMVRKLLLNSNDAKLQQAIVQTLGKLGSKESLKDLATLAKISNYTIDHLDATGAYTSLIERLIEKGDLKSAEGAAKSLMSDATKAKANHTRQTALILLMKAKPADASKLAINALKDSDSQYRFAALKAGLNCENSSRFIPSVMKVYEKAKPEVKKDIAGWLEESANCKTKIDVMKFCASQPLIADLATDNTDLQKAIALALVKIGDDKAINPFIKMLASDNDKTIAIAKQALASFNGNIADGLIANMPTASEKGKIASLELLANRKSSKHIGEIISYANTESENVKTAALASLKDVVEAKDINSMYSMLESADTKDIPALQSAVISALNYMPAEKRYSTIADKIAKTTDNKKDLYYTALAASGDPKALDMILDAFNKGNAVTKDAAFGALLTWNQIDAADHLLNICNDKNASAYFDRSLSAYIKLSSSTKLSGENRLLYLREAMAIAKTDDQKNEILKQVQRTGTFQGLLLAGQYLDNKTVQQSAAQAVMNIALNNKSYTGTEVERLLNKVIDVIDNPDAGYQKEGIKKHLREVPMQGGFVSLFNGKDLTGWKGLVKNPIERNKMKPAILAREQAKADKQMRASWSVENGQLIFNGKGDNICTTKQYGDFEMYVDWMLDPVGPEADAGIYLRGTPQVQIWDIARTNVGAEVGSGGLYNNTTNTSKPLKVADNKLGAWNTFYIKMIGDRVTVYLNGVLVTDNVILENYWDRSQPIFAMEQIELQAHGCKVYYRDIYVKEIERAEPFKLSAEEKKEGFEILFDGTNMHKWTGNTAVYVLEDGCISLHPDTRFGGNLYTKEEFSNFVYRFEFQLTPGANNGVGIRTPLEGDAAYVGMEIQILDHDNPIYNKITPLQVHGSVYGVLGAKRAILKPAGEWNYEEIVANGDNIKVTLNGEVILEGNLKEAMKNGAADGKNHPGVTNKSGHIAFLGHGNPIKFKNIRVKRLK